MILRFFLVGIALIVIVGGLVGMNVMRDKVVADMFANPQIPPVAVSAAKAEAKTWADYLEGIGTVSAVEGIQVASEVAGTVKSIDFKANDTVQAGQRLVQLDDSIDQTDARLYQAAIDLAQRTLDRVSSLRARGNAPQADLDTANAELLKAQAQLARAEAVIEKKAVAAPFAGIVGIRKVDIGRYVAAGDALVTLQRLDQVYADFTLPEQAFSRISQGQKVEVRADAFPDQVFRGQVTGIEPVVDTASRMVRVRATIDNPDLKLRPGFFANVRLILPERPNVVTVPQTAITFSLYGDTVFVIREKQAEAGQQQPAGPGAGQAPAGPQLVVEQVFVRVGQRQGAVAEIVEGVKAGDQVVTSGQLKLQNGFPVVIDNSVDPSRPPQAGS
ncbi:efflux RND transporter periplasmic adaptor subunit [Inquilinus sp. Marseille-Q2685]|uniref:efflux RND transporter periplasmic adaptor subunit n=1 Tax=Inquilinus sp. Marseille-Q2685 TaxID=2866581 RepID=UPI001CE4AFC4|nr:efflux RND transporter periplasmic adaptor subunit [Inquilinus sp. Marseille-Q2685]